MVLQKIKIALAVSFMALGLAGCNNTPTNQTVTEKDYAHDSLKLSLDYKNHDFFTDGVGQAELYTCIDGDTAHFTPVVKTTSSQTIKARFYGIDTPESTGRIQEYGKAASNFTKEHLKNAAENGTIVLAGVSSAYAEPTTDANGRFLCCVWINEEVEDAPYDTLVNLNLWIVQEGYSDVGSLDKMPEYADIFEAAYWQAKNLKKNKFSGEADPLFNYGEYEDAYIPDIAKAVQQQFSDPDYENPYNGAKVRIQGTVTGFSGNTLYLQQYDDETDQYYGVNVFCGMTAVPNKYLKVGNRLQLCAVAQDSENFGFQLTGAEGHFPIITSAATEDDCKILIKAEENTEDPTLMPHVFEMTAAELTEQVKAKNYETLFSGVKVTDAVTVNYFNANTDNDAWTIGFKNQSFDMYLTTAYSPSGATTWTKEEDWIGKSFNIEYGIMAFHKTYSGNFRFQLLLIQNSDLIYNA